MASKTYSIRLSDESLQTEISAYAAARGISESTAIGRLLLEGKKAREGKPILRFAQLDPGATTYFSVALNALRELAGVLRQCRAALARPRPVAAEDQAEWEVNKKAAADAFSLVSVKIAQLKKAGHLEFLLNDVNLKHVEVWYNHGIKNRHVVLVAVMGALLGRDTVMPPVPQVDQPKPETKSNNGDGVLNSDSAQAAKAADEGKKEWLFK